MTHPIHASDPDACCRWLCLSAGQRTTQRTTQDNLEISKALENLPYSKGSLPRLAFPIDPANIWRLAR